MFRLFCTVLLLVSLVYIFTICVICLTAFSNLPSRREYVNTGDRRTQRCDIADVCMLGHLVARQVDLKCEQFNSVNIAQHSQ